MKKYFLFSFFILFFCIAAVSADDNMTSDNLTADSFEEPSLSLDSSNDTAPQKSTSQIDIETKNLVKYYKNDSQFEINIFKDNQPVSNAKVSLKLNGNVYKKTTDNQGHAMLIVNLMPGKYKITTTYGNYSVTNTIKVLSRTISKDITSTYGKKVSFSVKLLNNHGKAMKNKLVTFKIGSKTYKKYTNSNGIAVLKLNKNAGTYTVRYSADGISGKNKYKVKNYFKITTYKWKSGADVTKNKLIKKNIPNSQLVKKIVKAAKKGTPVIKIKGGNGKKVFITSGVHGSELSSQVAALKLIKYLESHPVKGTVYIMPFMNPKGTASNVRNYAGISLNQKANVKGTISYKTVKLITKAKCSAYGDFHCTRPGGKPGKDIAMGTYEPTYKSAKLAKYIAKKSKVKHLIYQKAGAEYPGALEDTVSLKHIPAVTCEVVTPHGTIAKGSVGKSLSMMKSLLKFNGLL